MQLAGGTGEAEPPRDHQKGAELVGGQIHGGSIRQVVGRMLSTG
jgi:hypothetical protein